MNDLPQSIHHLFTSVDYDAVNTVGALYPYNITSYYASLISNKHDAIWRQCVPDLCELSDDNQLSDPLAEHSLSPVPGLIHRYPDRAVLLVSNRCAVYCRFCMRKRMVGNVEDALDEESFETACRYIETHPEITDIILSGGDPLMLDDASIDRILRRLRTIKHVVIIRIGTRIPVTLPERITKELCECLKKYHPLYVNTHFNHVDEITDPSARACERLADAGIPLGNQTVLLQGVNDQVETIRQLFTGLLKIRVRPYYLHQMDLVKGTAHFRTPIAVGLEIIRGLRGFVSGMAVPHFVVDLAGGKGKVPILPDYVEQNGDSFVFQTYTGERVIYTDITNPQG